MLVLIEINGRLVLVNAPLNKSIDMYSLAAKLGVPRTHLN
jgi:hypothetical protein